MIFILIIAFVTVLLIAGILIYAYYLLLNRGANSNQDLVPPVDRIVDVSELPCCMIDTNQFPIQTRTKFIAEYGLIVGLTPVPASVACIGNTVIGYDECERLVAPARADATTIANPVGRDGSILYYATRSAEGCVEGPC